MRSPPGGKAEWCEGYKMSSKSNGREWAAVADSASQREGLTSSKLIKINCLWISSQKEATPTIADTPHCASTFLSICSKPHNYIKKQNLSSCTTHPKRTPFPTLTMSQRVPAESEEGSITVNLRLETNPNEMPFQCRVLENWRLQLNTARMSFWNYFLPPTTNKQPKLSYPRRKFATLNFLHAKNTSAKHVICSQSSTQKSNYPHEDRASSNWNTDR